MERNHVQYIEMKRTYDYKVIVGSSVDGDNGVRKQDKCKDAETEQKCFKKTELHFYTGSLTIWRH